MLNIKLDLYKSSIEHFYDVQPVHLLTDEYPNLDIFPAMHKVDHLAMSIIPFIILNLSPMIFTGKGRNIGFTRMV